MPEQTLLQLEKLLQRMGSVEISEDVAHKYALRRALLNSTRFERNRFRIVWMRLFTYTTTLVAGGAVVAVLVVSVMSFELQDIRGAAAPVGAQRTTPAQLVDAQTRSMPEPVVPRSTPVQFASFEFRPEVQNVLEFATRPSINFAVAR